VYAFAMAILHSLAVTGPDQTCSHRTLDFPAALPYGKAVLVTVAETPVFTRRADALLAPGEREDLILRLARDPFAGDLVPGLGGIRKLRFGAGGRGKSGGFRVIYYAAGDEVPILALLLYGKNERADLSPDQRRTMRALVEQWREQMMPRRPGGA
jgi:mRNA-degrading endonuclease RelE of RelBE toxin-antitoxin system